MALNVFWGNKRIVIASVNDNQTARDVVEKLKAENFNNVVLFSAPKSYPGYYNVAEAEGAYTIFIEESASCKVQPCRVEGYSNERLGKYVSRDLNESQKAKEFYRHYLKYLELNPELLGSYKIPFDEVKHIDWYWTDKSPLLYVKVPKVDGVAGAVVEAIKDYFKDHFKN